MADNRTRPRKDFLKKPHPLAPLKHSPVASSDSAMGALKSAKFAGAPKPGKSSGPLSSPVKKAEECGSGTPGSIYNRPKSTLMKPTLSSSASCLPRRSNTGGISEKRAGPSPNRSLPVVQKVSPSVKHSVESRQASVPLASSKDSILGTSSHLLSKSASSKADSMRRSTNELSKTVPSSRIVSASSPESSKDRVRLGKTNSNISSSSSRSPSGASSLKMGSRSAFGDIVSSVPGRKKYPLTTESHDSHLIKLPQVDVKPRDDTDQQLEENPILEMLHLEDASDPTLKKFDDRGNPTIFSLKIVGEGIEGTTLHAEKKCLDGEEIDYIYHWFLTSPDGTMIEIEGAISASYKVTCNDIGFLISVSCDPISSDWVCGSTLTSGCIGPIIPGPPSCHSLEFLGSMVEGNHLSFVASYSGGGKGNCIHEWFRLSESGNKEKLSDDVFLDLTFEDVGRCIELVYTPVREDGLRGYKKSLISTSVAPGMPKIGKLEIEGRGFHTNLYAVRGIYSGGKEGKSKIQWLRSIIGSPDLISIPGEVGLMYEANVDDVGYRLVVIYTPVREDGVEGEAVSTSTEPIAVEPGLNREMKQKLEIGSMKFEVLIDKDNKVSGAGNLERRILEVNRKRIKVVKPGSKTSFPVTEIKGTYAPPFHVVLQRNDQHHFKIVVDRENEVELMVQTRQMRDIIVLVIRGLAQRFNSVSLNSLLRVDN